MHLHPSRSLVASAMQVLRNIAARRLALLVLLLTAPSVSAQSQSEPPEPVWGRGGFVPVFGGLGPTAGLTAGLRYDLFLRHPSLTLAGDLLGSTRLYAGARLLGGFENENVALYGFGRFRYMPKESFYGFGPGTDRGDAREYRLDEWTAGVSAGYRPSPFTFVGAHVTYQEQALAEFGLKEMAHLREQTATVQEPPLVPRDARHLIVGGWLEIDRRELPRDDETGYRFAPVSPSLRGLALGVTRGWYIAAEAVPHVALDSDDPSFVRFDLDGQLFIPLEYETDGLALRSHFTGTTVGDRAPAFYLLPTLGGSNSIRGFRPDRFRDRHALLFNAEYRRSLLLFLDGAVFVDAGQVFYQPSDLNLSNLEFGYGAGLRVRIGRWVLGRVDVAHSREGFQLYLRAGSFL